MDTKMPLIAILYGAVLIVIGAVGYFGSGGASATALIPAVLGLIAAISGLVARNEAFLKHAMHLAAMVGLFGFAGTVTSLPKIPSLLDGSAERPMAVLAQSVTCGLSLIFLVLCVRSFIAARKAREAGA